MERRVVVQWTATAKRQLATLPPKVRKGILRKAGDLRECDDPRAAHKPLVGPLAGHYRLTYGRYRAVYSVSEDRLANGDALLTIRVLFVAVGKRQERSRDDIYRLARKMVEMGMIDVTRDEDESDQD